MWNISPLPQNRELSMLGAGDGSLYLYKYHYPDQRKVKVSGRGGGGDGSLYLYWYHYPESLTNAKSR